MTNNLIELIKEKTNLQTNAIQNIIKLLDEGCTIPFIARYRKDFTNGATDEELRIFEEVYEYSKKLLDKKEEIKNILKEKNFLDEKVLKNIEEAKTLQAIEDIYAPFKEKKSSRTTTAIENGLEPLANIIQSMKYTLEEVNQKAKQFLNENVKNIDEAIDGAKDIIAQRYADDFKSKEVLRNLIANWGTLEVKEAKEFDKNGLYAPFVNSNEKIRYIKSRSEERRVGKE